MPIGDLVYNSDLQNPDCGCNSGSNIPTIKPLPTGNTTCNCDNSIWLVPPPPRPLDYPPYPPFPPYVPPVPPIEPKSTSKEAQICKLSKKSATIKKLIENYTEKNKDVIFKIGGVSYNFGTYKVYSKGDQGEKVEEDSVYGARILSILEDELAAIKLKIQELAADLDDDDDIEASGIETTVTQG